jgi:hypothetical protein
MSRLDEIEARLKAATGATNPNPNAVSNALNELRAHAPADIAALLRVVRAYVAEKAAASAYDSWILDDDRPYAMMKTLSAAHKDAQAELSAALVALDATEVPS